VVGGQYGVSTPAHTSIQQHSDFAKRSASIGQGIHATAQNLLKLSQLAKRTGKFDDPAVEIANLSAIIKQDIQALNIALVDLQSLSAASRAGNKQSSSHSHSVVDSLRVRLRDTTKDFQNVLQVRKENLEKNKARQQQFSSAPERPAFAPARPGMLDFLRQMIMSKMTLTVCLHKACICWEDEEIFHAGLNTQPAAFSAQRGANGPSSSGLRVAESSQHLFGVCYAGMMQELLGGAFVVTCLGRNDGFDRSNKLLL
jgi:hypothetical protein